MAITHKIAATLVAMFAALLLGAAIILSMSVGPGFERLEQAAHARNLARVAAVVQAISDDVRARTSDYASWDAAYYYVGGQAPDFADYFNDAWLQDYGVDLIAFVGADGDLLWRRRRLSDGRVIEDAALVRRLADEAQARARRATADNPAVGVVYIENEGAMIVAAAPARLGEGSGRERGLVLMGRRLEANLLAHQTQLSAAVLAPSAAPAFARPHLDAVRGDAPQSWRSNDRLYGLFSLGDFGNDRAALILTEQPREIAAQGARAMGIALALFAAMSAILFGALWLLLRGGVISRIIRLEQHFNAQTAVPQRLDVEDKAGDEITRLTQSYNALVARLRETMARERAAQLQSEAEAAANRMKSDFLANVSHELRTPLNAVIGYAELIKEELNEDGVTRTDDDLKRIVSAARRLLVLVNEILDLSKIEVGGLELRPDTFKVEEMLERAMTGIHPVAAAHNVSVRFVTSNELGLAYSDEFRLRQCLINVLATACKFAPEGEVSIKAERCNCASGDKLRIEIRNTGAGLTPDQLRYAFEPFQRAEASIAATIGGASLGLAMARKLLALLGGHIDVTSERGEGSTFVIVAPVLAEDAPAPKAEAA